MKPALLAIFLLLVFAPLQAGDQVDTGLQRLLAGEQRPEGVVFEIIAWQDNTWDWAAPKLRVYVDQLRAKHPDLEVALISHGAELFDLARSAGSREKPAMRELARLSAEGVEIHVCGEYARWKRLGPTDFLDFVDVAASGNAQLADYVRLGYAHIKLEPPHGID
jgi:intracellular sulfur oxidation DsrE/DsrF family protein